MPNNSVIAEGNTTNEAIENGLKILNVSKDMVNVKVLETEKKSFFSILAPRVVKVELTLKNEEEIKNINKQHKSTTFEKKELKEVDVNLLENAEKDVKLFLENFLNQIGKNITYIIQKNNYGLEIAINGQDAGFLIGYRGETLYALQTVISSVANKHSDQRIRVLLDIENYKNKREKTLEDLALKIAKTVERTRKPVTLEPMQAYERKIIHAALQASNTVKTESVGEEPRRRVVISLK